MQTAEEALLHFDEKQYRLFAYVSMPNHCHLVIKPLGKMTLQSVLQQRKSFIATRARRIIAGAGSFWHEESYDRIIRDTSHLYRVLSYIENNPARARLSRDKCRLGLCQEWQEWYDTLTGGMSQFPKCQ